MGLSQSDLHLEINIGVITLTIWPQVSEWLVINTLIEMAKIGRGMYWEIELYPLDMLNLRCSIFLGSC